MFPHACLSFFLLAVATPSVEASSQSSTDRMIEGRITDQLGFVIPGAEVHIRNSLTNTVQSVLSDENGQFIISDLLPYSYEVTIQALGFAEQTQLVELEKGGTIRLNIVLRIASLVETITVTATRSEQRVGDVPASQNVLTRDNLERSSALTVDDGLRQAVPTFSLYRRTSSLVAAPSTQGVSLRGINPSAVSRSLVLLDEVPLNDPSGGWVYWSRIPKLSIDRIEVVEGPTSSLYGNSAMGGVISILTKRPQRRTLLLETFLGTLKTSKLDFFASDIWGNWGAAVEGSLFHTDGYKIVRESERGLVDTEANSDYRNFNLKLDYESSEDFNFFLKGGYSGEGRQNGTPLQANDTQWKSLAGGLRFRTDDGSNWKVSLFSHFQSYAINFSAVAPDRNSERLTSSQEAPTNGLGGSAQWSKFVAGSHLLTLGTDWRWIDFKVDTHTFALRQASVVRTRLAGGRQQFFGAFFQDLFTPLPRLQVSLSARFDRWHNYHASVLEEVVSTGATTLNELADKDNSVLSPRVGLLYHLTDKTSIWSAFSWGFRAPTLYELYQPFRVGKIFTGANAQLGPERLIGSESGFNYSITPDLFWRTTGFWNRVKDSVSNVTLEITPNLITRQRQNLGEIRIWGVQTELKYHPSVNWRLSSHYFFNNPFVHRFALNPELEGKRLVQKSKHQIVAQALYSNPKTVSLSLQGRYVGAAFDDDRNLYRLGGYFVLDVMGTHRMGERCEVFLGVTNLFDRKYLISTRPNRIGTPLTLFGGIRLRLSGD